MPTFIATATSTKWIRVSIVSAIALCALAGCGAVPDEDAGRPRAPVRRTDAGPRDVTDASEPGDPIDAGEPIGSDRDAVAASEVCGNGFDDDRNGSIDEDCPCLPGATQRCYPGDPMEPGHGPCQFGVQQCTGSGEFGRWGACAGAIQPTPEICDNADNDCDGRIDEMLARACTATCGAGSQTCTAGAWSTCMATAPCPDAGMPLTDAGIPTNTTCHTAIDVTPHGRGDVRTVSGTTCGATDLVHLGCNRVPAPEVFYLWNAPGEPYTVRWTVTPGFVTGLAQEDEACRPTTVDCDTRDEADYAHTHTLVVERVGGGCGAFTLSVTRTY